jgi:4-hydroxythreonine-4-phosphate dehydrogenase
VARAARSAAPRSAAPRIAISLGDPSGIGAEVTAAALAALRGEVEPLLFGDPGLLARGLGALGLPVIGLGEPVPRGGALVAVTRLPAAALRAGRPSARGASAQLAFLTAAFDSVVNGQSAPCAIR